MARTLLLVTGFALAITHHFIVSIPYHLQVIVLLGGVVLIGVPHGAADLLVGIQNAGYLNKSFSRIRFFALYLGRLLLFGAILIFFPLQGILLFIIFAAYHFGETDLSHINTDSYFGKGLVVAYGFVILGIVLLHNFDEVKSILYQLPTGQVSEHVVLWMDAHRNDMMGWICIVFIAAILLYFVFNPATKQKTDLYFLIRFICLNLLLFNMPLLLGFSFYFIFWHSTLSLYNIIHYLQQNSKNTAGVILKQISVYSLLAMAGIGLFAVTGFLFSNTSALLGYVFSGLAVLTAPHMQVMHNMYHNIRQVRQKVTPLPEVEASIF